MKHIGRFFDYARERHSVYLRRKEGLPKPWTADKIIQQYRFTNVFRELDKTTVWFREKVRDPLRNTAEVLLATVVFRMLNRIETGEAIFLQKDIEFGTVAFEEFLECGKVQVLKHAIRQYVGKRGPYVTGAYIISSPSGYSKLGGMMKVIGDFHRKSGWRDVAEAHLAHEAMSLRGMFDFLCEQPFLGKFHSYEIVTDLRHTSLLSGAPDINTWANMGPGAKRGLNRVHGRKPWDAKIDPEQALEEMRVILDASRDSTLWPQGGKRTAKSAQNTLDWPRWELREVEHTLCEFDKYERVRLGEGKPRGVYR